MVMVSPDSGPAARDQTYLWYALPNLCHGPLEVPMKLLSLEPTPNPNSMKLNLDESLPKGVATTYRPEGKDHYPPGIQRLLSIPGVQSLYRAVDFLAVQRVPSASWETLLAQVREVLGGEEAPHAPAGERSQGERWGEVRIAVQHFRRIPMLVKVSDDEQEVRVALPSRFGEAVQKAAPASPNMLLERRWLPQSPRFGELQQVGEEVAAELDAAYDPPRLEALVRQAFESTGEVPEAREKPSPETLAKLLEHPDWKRRYASLEAAGADPACFGQLVEAMRDAHATVRRLATVLVGLVGTPKALEPLCGALKDPAVAVRRSAGDALNDLGDPAALPAMEAALADPNKLVRWRAARFLFERGGRENLDALGRAQDDPEFEVRMQVRQAMERIEGGLAAQGPIWARMTQLP
jgi:hypothetical protein